MTQRFAIGPRETATLDTSGLREHFLIENIFVAGEIELTYTHYDRMMVGGAQPLAEALPLLCPESLKAKFFLERREILRIGIVNPFERRARLAERLAHAVDMTVIAVRRGDDEFAGLHHDGRGFAFWGVARAVGFLEILGVARRAGQERAGGERGGRSGEELAAVHRGITGCAC